MKTSDIPILKEKFIEKLEKDFIRKAVINNSEWMIDTFEKYCKEHQIEEINFHTIKDFYSNQLNMDICESKCPIQTSLRRQLLAFFDFCKMHFYQKQYKNPNILVLTKYYNDFLEKYQEEYVNIMNIEKKSKIGKIRTLARFFQFLERQKIQNLTELKISDVANYILEMKEINKFKEITIANYKIILREALNFFYVKKIIKFSGNEAFPFVKKPNRSQLISSYSIEEIEKLINAVDTSTSYGKFSYSVLTFLVYYGIRIGDILNLKYENIDFEKNSISFVQNKTKKRVTLPLLDEVKFPLLDYLKNSRPYSEENPDFIFITHTPPFTKYHSSSTIREMITKLMDKAGIDYKNKHHGPHSLRHSLATNLINNDVPIATVGQILGHTSSLTTEIYITKGTKNLRKLTLEVPNE